MPPGVSPAIDRDMSLIEFERRVLDEARDPRNPLLERVKFLGILGRNLDEFVMVRGTPAGGLYRFLAAYVRYRLHVYAYLMLVGNPFPGFTGAPGTYPLDLEVEGPRRQNRWKTGFRIVLAIPAFLVNAALGGALFASAVLTWFYALVKASAPWGLRNLSAYAIRYDAQLEGYLLLLTDSYPHASPLEGDDTPVE